MCAREKQGYKLQSKGPGERYQLQTAYAAQNFKKIFFNGGNLNRQFSQAHEKMFKSEK